MAKVLFRYRNWSTVARISVDNFPFIILLLVYILLQFQSKNCCSYQHHIWLYCIYVGHFNHIIIVLYKSSHYNDFILPYKTTSNGLLENVN